MRGGISACEEVLLGEFTTFEHLALSLNSDATVLIMIVCRPPKPKYDFLDGFSESLSTDYDCLINSGDFNIHVYNQTDPPTIRAILGT